MAIDLAAIRKKVKQLSNNRSSSKIQFWKVDPGEYNVRAVPWPAELLKDGQPFIERWFYYIGDNKGILAPFQFGLEDPVADLRKKLYESGDPGDREIAGKLRPKMRCYLALVERGKEADGVQVFSFGKLIYRRLLDFFLDEEIGDWMDPKKGLDLKVKITKKAESQWRDTEVDVARRTSQLADTDEEIKGFLESVPNIDDVFKQKSVEEIEKVLTEWLSDGDVVEDDGSSRNDSASTALDDLVADVKNDKRVVKADKSEPSAVESVDEKDQTPQKKTRKKSSKDELSDLISDPVPAQTLDSAFKELMDE